VIERSAEAFWNAGHTNASRKPILERDQIKYGPSFGTDRGMHDTRFY
jgi:hypothetical protein